MANTLLAISLVIAAFGAALSALLVFALLDRRRDSTRHAFSEIERDAIVFLFDGDALLDATPAARRLLDVTPRRGRGWADLSALLAPRFPQLDERVAELATMGEIQLPAADGVGRLRAEWHDGIARIALEIDEEASNDPALDPHSLMAMRHELDGLRANAEATPFPLWREDPSGEITWCNRAYLELTDRLGPTEEPRPWPLPKVFPASDPAEATEAGAPRRVAVTPDGAETRHWFEVSETAVAEGEHLCVALPADRLVRAETTLEEFVTTLTKTFAALPIGLAIFDRTRELTLFNPALTDLTLLPAEFLVARPTLAAFLDKLREARMMPEPKDYKSWRQQMFDLVAAAQNGTYEETWTLPTGQTYRVTGRPHPDGAVALLFEDISADISLARRFRAEIETGQAALDALPQAVAVFTPGGVLSISNRAYAALWGSDPSSSLGELTLSDATRGWQEKCAPSPVWDRIRAFEVRPGPRLAWQAPIALADGRAFNCRVTPLAGGATMVDFSPPAAPAAAAPVALGARIQA